MQIRSRYANTPHLVHLRHYIGRPKWTLLVLFNVCASDCFYFEFVYGCLRVQTARRTILGVWKNIRKIIKQGPKALIF